MKSLLFPFLLLSTVSDAVLRSHIHRANEHLSLEMRATSSRAPLVAGLGKQHFARLGQDEHVLLLCSKRRPGQLSAFVNTRQAEAARCLEYAAGHSGDDVFCNKQEFKVTLMARGYSYYEVLCTFTAEPHTAVRILLNRLCELVTLLQSIFVPTGF